MRPAPSSPTKTSTIAGSNCVPAAVRSRAAAASGSSRRRYGRSVVIAWNESQTRTTRASTGISSPAFPSGYPSPSHRS